MQRSLAKNSYSRLSRQHVTNAVRSSEPCGRPAIRPPCDVFINHRGVDTKKSVAGLLYDHLLRLNLRPFLDSKSMSPGDKLFDRIESAVVECKVGIAVFSPRYCESYFCLHELALIAESRKILVPIFCDVKPSELRVRAVDSRHCRVEDLRRFHSALEEAKLTVGLTFDTSTGDWSEFLKSASNIVINNLMELGEEYIKTSNENN